MKKIIITIVVVVVLLIAYWLVSPFFIDKRVSEDVPVLQDKSQQYSAKGSFVGFDAVHYGSGTASIIQTDAGYVLRFEEDFAVANGPDLYVGLGQNGNYIKGSEISRLKGNIGSQNYALPKDFDIKATNEIWIWCRAFSVPFARAVLVQ